MIIPVTTTTFAEPEYCSSLTEPDDDFYCDDFDWDGFGPQFSYDREWADEMCDASEDYAKNPKNCDKAYKLVEEKEKEVEEIEDWRNTVETEEDDDD